MSAYAFIWHANLHACIHTCTHACLYSCSCTYSIDLSPSLVSSSSSVFHNITPHSVCLASQCPCKFILAQMNSVLNRYCFCTSFLSCRLWDLTKWTCVVHIPNAHSQGIRNLCVSPAGAFLVSTANDSEAR